jgi:tRNA (guanine-N7-)-methyltransferase
MSAGVSARQRLNVLTRPALPGEFVPAEYFRRLDRADLGDPARPLEVDLGCGDGSFLVAMAAHYPDRDFLGVERLLGRVGKVGRKIVRMGLTNCRVMRLESRYTVEWLLPEAAVERLHLLCPDPWPKVRHHRRRLVQAEFLAAVRRVLVPHGEFLFMTDHEDYAAWVREVVATVDGFAELPWSDGDFFYPKTDFQEQWEREGRTMHRLRLAKVPAQCPSRGAPLIGGPSAQAEAAKA